MKKLILLAAIFTSFQSYSYENCIVEANLTHPGQTPYCRITWGGSEPGSEYMSGVDSTTCGLIAASLNCRFWNFADDNE